MDATAIVLSPVPVARSFPGALTLNHVSRFDDVAGFTRECFAAISRVRTPRFFFFDSDDELPVDFAGVLAECLAHDAALVYTDELIVRGDVRVTRSAGPYCAHRHAKDPTMVHHLAVCRTADAQALLPALCPLLASGPFSMEPLLYSQLARIGWAYVPRVGYVWHCRRDSGLHLHPSNVRGQVNAMRWIAQQ